MAGCENARAYGHWHNPLKVGSLIKATDKDEKSTSDVEIGIAGLLGSFPVFLEACGMTSWSRHSRKVAIADLMMAIVGRGFFITALIGGALQVSPKVPCRIDSSTEPYRIFIPCAPSFPSLPCTLSFLLLCSPPSWTLLGQCGHYMVSIFTSAESISPMWTPWGHCFALCELFHVKPKWTLSGRLCSLLSLCGFCLVNMHTTRWTFFYPASDSIFVDVEIMCTHLFPCGLEVVNVIPKWVLCRHYFRLCGLSLVDVDPMRTLFCPL